MLVLMAIITTMITTPMMHLLYLKNQPKSPVRSDRGMLTPVHGHDRAASAIYPPGLALGPAHSGVAMSLVPTPSNASAAAGHGRGMSAFGGNSQQIPLDGNNQPSSDAGAVATPPTSSVSNDALHQPDNNNIDNIDVDVGPRIHYDTTLPAGDAPPALPPSSSGVELSSMTPAPPPAVHPPTSVGNEVA
jgi:hypothetical protein